MNEPRKHGEAYCLLLSSALGAAWVGEEEGEEEGGGSEDGWDLHFWRWGLVSWVEEELVIVEFKVGILYSLKGDNRVVYTLAEDLRVLVDGLSTPKLGACQANPSAPTQRYGGKRGGVFLLSPSEKHSIMFSSCLSGKLYSIENTRYVG